MASVRDQPWPLSAKLAVGLAASFVATAYSYYVLERPFLKLKERFTPAKPRDTRLQPDVNETGYPSGLSVTLLPDG